MAYTQELRAEAAQAAATLFSNTPVDYPMLDKAFNWFLGKISGARLVIRLSPVTYTQGGLGDPAESHPTILTKDGVQMKDTDQVHAALEFDDAKGFATVDGNAVSWTVADPSVCAAQPDTDGSGGCLFVAGSPGSTVATVTDGVVSGTVAIDVTAGDVASIKVVLGDPVPQPVA